MTVRLVDEQPCPTCGGTLQTRSLCVGDAGLKFVRSIPCPACDGNGVRVSPVSCAGCRWYSSLSLAVKFGHCTADADSTDAAAGQRVVVRNWGCLSWEGKEATDGNG